ncbi:hypothetical protein JTE90_021850 [Oedothorax gibbosus]|uniref:Uncharacterized protein n=1 Tax=Oedothorax gibbosus TaxID=931172 RepID=A0AAV6UXZ3_9ARAC|nr:hypothetical protein JTE90_021850 [Oedothorax gibbosus]
MGEFFCTLSFLYGLQKNRRIELWQLVDAKQIKEAMVTIALSPRVAKAVSGSRFIHMCQPPQDWSRLLYPKAWNIVVESNRKGKGRDAPELCPRADSSQCRVLLHKDSNF